jgi:hypothetical protein
MLSGLGAACILDGLQITISKLDHGVLTQYQAPQVTSTEIGPIALIYRSRGRGGPTR